MKHFNEKVGRYISVRQHSEKWALNSLPYPDAIGIWLKDCWKGHKAWIKQTNQWKSNILDNARQNSHLENQFFASFPEPKGQLTQSLVHVVSIGATCRSETAQIFPTAALSCISIFRFFFRTKRSIDLKLDRKYECSLWIKNSETCFNEKLGWPLWGLS